MNAVHRLQREVARHPADDNACRTALGAAVAPDPGEMVVREVV